MESLRKDGTSISEQARRNLELAEAGVLVGATSVGVIFL